MFENVHLSDKSKQGGITIASRLSLALEVSIKIDEYPVFSFITQVSLSMRLVEELTSTLELVNVVICT